MRDSNKTRMMRVPSEFWTVIDNWSRKDGLKKIKVLKRATIILDNADKMTDFFGFRKRKR